LNQNAPDLMGTLDSRKSEPALGMFMWREIAELGIAA
jgi:hypothetical protein